MKKINHLLTTEEKEIILNYFLFSKENAKKVVSDFALQTIKKYSKLYDHVRDLEDLRNASKNLDVEINLIWEKDTNLTAQMYCLKHRLYKDSYSKMKIFRFFNSDMTMKDIHGETALMKLSKNIYGLRTIYAILIGEECVKSLNKKNDTANIAKLTKDNMAKMYGYHFNDFNHEGDNIITLSLKSLSDKLISVPVSKHSEYVIESLELLEKLKNAWFENIQRVYGEKTKYFIDLGLKSIDLLIKCCDKEQNVSTNKYNYGYIRKEIAEIKKEFDSILLNINLNEDLKEKNVESKKMKV